MALVFGGSFYVVVYFVLDTRLLLLCLFHFFSTKHSISQSSIISGRSLGISDRSFLMVWMPFLLCSLQ